MYERLVYYNVTFSPHMTKKELFSIIQDFVKRLGLNNSNKYIVDKMAHEAGHEVVRLPVADCTLNPIELAWAQVKGHIKANTSRFTLDEVKDLAWKGFEVTPEQWVDLVKHIRDKVEDHYWDNDRLELQEQIRLPGKFVIHLSDESSDESDDDVPSEGTFSNSSSLNDNVATSNNEKDI